MTDKIPSVIAFLGRRWHVDPFAPGISTWVDSQDCDVFLVHWEANVYRLVRTTPDAVIGYAVHANSLRGAKAKLAALVKVGAVPTAEEPAR